MKYPSRMLISLCLCLSGCTITYGNNEKTWVLNIQAPTVNITETKRTEALQVESYAPHQLYSEVFDGAILIQDSTSWNH